MSAIFLHDSGRSGATTWAVDSVRAGLAVGMILSPFSVDRNPVPRRGRTPGRPGAADAVARVTAAGGEVLLDPTTHGVLAVGADLFEQYDSWELWDGPRGTLSDVALADHAHRVSERAAELGVTALSPTVALESPTGRPAELAMYLAESWARVAPTGYQSIVGSASFWASGSTLDAYVGELTQLRPRGWAIAIRRDSLRHPTPGMDPREVEGLCRTVHSLSLRGQPVIACRSDLAGLPLVAAGATHVGSGWDLRHRVCADDIFRRASGIRRASDRVTHQGLLAWLKRVEAETLQAADSRLSARLVSGALPADRKAHWMHHLRVLNDCIDEVRAAGADRQSQVDALARRYRSAAVDFGLVESLAGKLDAGASQWISPLAGGLALYAQGEGW